MLATLGPGESAALGTAVCWSFTAIFFAAAARRAGAPGVNLLRLLLAVGFLGLLVLARGAASPLPAPQAILLLLSGVAGLALGDAAYFRALEYLGARRAALLMALAPVFTALIAPALLGERLAWLDLAGMAVTLGGVLWVQAEEDAGGEIRGSPARGALFGVLGALGQAGGFVLARAGLGAAPAASALASWGGLAARTDPGGEALSGVPVDPLYGTFLRMVAGAGCMAAVALLHREGARMRGVIADRRALAFTLGGTALGPVVGVWLSLVAVRSAGHVAVASTLMSTSPVFVIPLGRLVHGHRASARAWIGAVVAVAGVALLTLG